MNIETEKLSKIKTMAIKARTELFKRKEFKQDNSEKYINIFITRIDNIIKTKTEKEAIEQISSIIKEDHYSAKLLSGSSFDDVRKSISEIDMEMRKF